MSTTASGLARLLRADVGDFTMRSVMASGDCFYDCMHAQLPVDNRPHEALNDPGAMRDYVADSLTEEHFAMYQMYAQAGVEDYAFMSHHHGPRSLAELKTYARVRGKNAGAGHCLWADQHAQETIARLAGVMILMIDEQAHTRGNRSGRTRGEDCTGADSRFLVIGAAQDRAVMLHRSRRQHFSAIFWHGEGVMALQRLPELTRSLWPSAGLQAAVECAAALEIPDDSTSTAPSNKTLASSSAAAHSPGAQPAQDERDAVVNTLVGMGFDPLSCEQATEEENGDLARSLDWLLAHSDESTATPRRRKKPRQS